MGDTTWYQHQRSRQRAQTVITAPMFNDTIALADTSEPFQQLATEVRTLANNTYEQAANRYSAYLEGDDDATRRSVIAYVTEDPRYRNGPPDFPTDRELATEISNRINYFMSQNNTVRGQARQTPTRRRDVNDIVSDIAGRIGNIAYLRTVFNAAGGTYSMADMPDIRAVADRAIQAAMVKNGFSPRTYGEAQ